MQLLDITPSLVKKTDIVNSGGGVRGVWQWDLYNYLKPHLDINSFSGTSTGSLTSLLGALDVPHDAGDAIYEEVCRNNARSIFKPGLMELKDGKLKKKLSFYWNLATNLDKTPGLMKIDPLIDTIEQILRAYPRFKYKYFFYFVDLYTGSTVISTPDDYDSTHELARGIAASCAIPGLVEPVRDIKTKKGLYSCCVDAGVREGFPLKGAFQSQVEGVKHQIVGLGCNTKEMTPEKNLQGILNIVGASAYNALNEMMIGDIESAQLMNYLVREKAAVADDKNDVPIILYYYKGGCGTLQFTPEARLSMKQTAHEDYLRIVDSGLTSA